VIQRPDDFAKRRALLAGLTEEQLKERFWSAAFSVVAPLVELARQHTSPSIERSVLLRMGFSSIEAKTIVELCAERGLLGKGAGHVVLKYAEARGLSIKAAGEELCSKKGWNVVQDLFKKGGVALDTGPKKED